MKKRLLSVLLALTFIMASAVVAFPASADVITDAEFVAPEILIPETIRVPDNDLITNNQEFYLAEGTRWQQKVTTDFLAEGKKGRGTYNHQKYIVVHNTGAYPASSTALSNHNYGKNTDDEVSWHYTCGNDGIYQMIPVNEKGWHAGGNYWGTTDVNTKLEMGWVSDASNSTGIGIETATPGFPAEQTSSGELWDTDEMYEWYENTFDSTATYLAELVAYICVSLNFNPYTQVVQHYSTAAKNCPIQMRYVFGTGGKTFTFYGTYFKVFLDRMYDYYEAMGGTYTSADTSIKNVYYNPNGKVYAKGEYSATADVTVYRAGNTATENVGTIASGKSVYVKQTGWNWGKVTLSDGKEGWVNLDSLKYEGEGYELGTYRTESGDIVNVTDINDGVATIEGGSDVNADVNIDGFVDNLDAALILKLDAGLITELPGGDLNGDGIADNLDATIILKYDAGLVELPTGGTAPIDSLTKVYKVTVKNDDTFGAESKYFAAGETFEVTANAPEGVFLFDIWEVTNGSASIEDKNATTTTITVLASDVELQASYRDTYDLSVESGAGSGRYKPGEVVTITARNMAGKVFTGWSLISGEGTIADATAETTTFTMASSDATVKASYEDMGELDLTGLTNFAAGKSYVTTWKDSTTIEYYDANTSDNNLTKFTDGVIATAGYTSNTSNFVSFKGTGGKAEITINLGETRNITDVVLRDITVHGTSWTGLKDGTLAVAYSTDGETFTDVANLTDTIYFSAPGGTMDKSLETHLVEFDAFDAQYVRVSFNTSSWGFGISEIEVLGAEPAKENLAAGKSYVTTWKGSTEITYASASADPDLTKFTDGTLGTVSCGTQPADFVVFQGTGGEGTVAINLGASASINTVIVNGVTTHGSWKDFTSIVISTSTNGETYTNVTNAVDTTEAIADGTVTNHTITFDAVDAQYVKITFVTTSYQSGFAEAIVYAA